MDKKFDGILDECLKRIVNGEQTVEECLASYPEQASDLEPLLRMALSVREASAAKAPFGAKERIEYRLQAAFKEKTQPKLVHVAIWRRRWAGVVASMLALLLAGGSTVAASSNSLPDQRLYPVKLATEQVQVSLTRSEVSKAELQARLIERRISEQQQMARLGRADKVEMLNAQLMKNLDNIERVGARPSQSPAQERELAKLRQHVTDVATKHQAVYEQLLKQAPEPARPALTQARDKSLRRYQDVIHSLNKNSGAPGGSRYSGREGGTVTSIEGVNIVLQTPRGAVAITTNSETKYQVPGTKEASLTDVKAGDRLWITIDKTEAGTIAKLVIVLPKLPPQKGVTPQRNGGPKN